MLSEAIKRACEIYHIDESGTGYNRAYDGLLDSMVPVKWKQPEFLDQIEVEKVVNFINGNFRGRMQASASQLLPALREILPHLNVLRNMNIISVNFNESLAENIDVRREIEVCFNLLADSGPRHESTGTSKILHIINPNLFVMWDSAIRGGYGFAG